MDAPRLPERAVDGHKGVFGTVLVAGGSMYRAPDDDAAPMRTVMLGGPCLTALAALRSGAGLCRMLLPDPMVMPALSIVASATAYGLPVTRAGDLVAHEAAASLDHALGDAACLAIGPGLGTAPGAQAMVLRAVQQERAPVVVDADALNCLAMMAELHRDFRCRGILTPHVGEYRRLARALGCDADPTTEEGRIRAAEQVAQRLGCVVVLKSSVTVVSDGQRSWEHGSENPVLATGGSGDVLAGIVAGLAAQHGGALDLFEVARCAVEAHARAGALWRERERASGGMLAADLLELLPGAVEGLRGGARTGKSAKA